MDVVELSGEIDLNHSPKLRAELQKKSKARCAKLLVDFTNVKYIDSSGLATFVEYYQTSRPYNGKIVLAAMSKRVKSVFELVRLSELFTISDTLEEAKQKLA